MVLLFQLQFDLHKGILTPAYIDVFGWDSNEKVESLTAELGKHYVLFPGSKDEVMCCKTKKKGLRNFLSRNKWKLFNGQNKDPHGCLRLSKALLDRYQITELVHS